MNKKELQQTVQDVEDVLTEVQLGDSSLAGELEEKQKEIRTFRAKVPVVGAFSAGKSALLNTFMGGDEILKENISMETAIATELCYSGESDPYAIRVKKDGTKERCTLEEAKAKDPSDCLKYIFCLPNESLRKLHDITLVDMPGYSSGVEAHNMAIAQYIDEAAGYVYVIPVTAGTFDDASRNFLDEIQQYSQTLRFVLTKCDLRTEAECREVAAEVQENVEDLLGHPVTLLKTSSRSPEAQAELGRLFSELDPDDMMLQKMGASCCALMMKASGALQEQEHALSFNSSELDAKLRENSRKQSKLKSDLELQKKTYHRKMQQEGVNHVMAGVSEALETGVPQLVSALQSGPSAFGNAVNSLLRPVIKESMSYVITENCEGMVEGLVESLEQGDSGNADEIAGKMTASLEAAGTLLEGAKKLAKMRNYAKLYKAVTTGAAVLTSVVAPAVELVIIFLPEILGFLSKIFGSTPEEKIEQALRSRVIPQICESLRPKIAESLRDAEENMVREIEASFLEQMDAVREAMERLKQEKEQKQLDVDAKKRQLENGIAKIETARQSIETAMQGA